MLDIQNVLLSFSQSNLTKIKPSKEAIETAWKIAKLSVTRYQFNPTDCVLSNDGGVALVWVHPTNEDRYCDIECCNDSNVHACLSSKEKELLEEWQILDFGVPIIGEKLKHLDLSLGRMKLFMVDGSLV